MTDLGDLPPPSLVLGVPVHMVSLDRALDWAEARLHARRPAYVCHLDARSILAARDDPAVLSAIAGAGLAGPDGMPLVWIGRARGFPVDRVYGPDFMAGLMARTAARPERPIRHFLFGTTPATLDRLTQRLERRFPGLSIAGSHAPPMGGWGAEEEEHNRAIIEAARADIVWVGLGAPRQDLWMAANRPHLSAPLLVGVGAAFHFLAGTKPQAPPLLRRAGLEWAFRLLTEPRRLLPRYGATVPRFAALALAEEIRRRRGP